MVQDAPNGAGSREVQERFKKGSRELKLGSRGFKRVKVIFKYG